MMQHICSITEEIKECISDMAAGVNSAFSEWDAIASLIAIEYRSKNAAIFKDESGGCDAMGIVGGGGGGLTYYILAGISYKFTAGSVMLDLQTHANLPRSAIPRREAID